ncbi:MAG TPA: aminodeoxychorismate/anthranilate synthase component II [Bacteroidales bacterium]|nr:aminodeoxychorismate/anthranilate synthase component II [Bacteroidales bacterium]
MAVPDIKILIVDNYDSFTYNIAHTIRNYPGTNLQIIEAGRIDLQNIDTFDKIIFSPGPDLPRPGNVMEQILNGYAGKKSILGICLGLQAIVLFFGGKLKQLEEVIHGRKKVINKTGEYSGMLCELPSSFEAGLYHSWIADPDYLPDSLAITAVYEKKKIMGIRHKIYDIEAVQFHPESIMTPYGNKMIYSWLSH